MKIEKVPGTRAFLAKSTKEGTSTAKPNNAQSAVRVEFTSPICKILYQSKISYNLLVICITIRATRIVTFFENDPVNMRCHTSAKCY